MRRALLAGLLALLVFVPTAAASSPPQSGKLNVNIAIIKFGVAHGKTTANGVATATLSDNAGRITRIKQPISLAVKSGGFRQNPFPVPPPLHLEVLRVEGSL